MSIAIRIRDLVHHYGPRKALDLQALDVRSGQVFAILGPNGGGKTTLFRVLSTLVPLQRGDVEICGHSLRQHPAAVRALTGVVFQASSLDRKLTVRENLRHQGHLYGLHGAELRRRSDDLLSALGLSDRARDRVETLSGGLRRRVEIAKGLLHAPRLLLLDEPSTGLDPAARADVWSYLAHCVNRQGTTVLLTTHLLDEADRASRIAILHAGCLVAEGTPDQLRQSLDGESITIHTSHPEEIAAAIGRDFDARPKRIGTSLRWSAADAHALVPRLMSAYGARIDQIAVGHPTLEDVFIARTGHRFWEADPEHADGH
jgi:ABC-2 type transport system ATP-binding protein